MKIYGMKMNGIKDPIGFELNPPVCSWKAERNYLLQELYWSSVWIPVPGITGECGFRMRNRKQQSVIPRTLKQEEGVSLGMPSGSVPDRRIPFILFFIDTSPRKKR